MEASDLFYPARGGRAVGMDHPPPDPVHTPTRNMFETEPIHIPTSSPTPFQPPSDHLHAPTPVTPMAWPSRSGLRDRLPSLALV